MKQERKRKQKQKGVYQVKRFFEPDRMAPVNLQVAYEQVVSSERYRIISFGAKRCERERGIRNAGGGHVMKEPRVAFYARVSSEQQAEAGTIDSQIASLAGTDYPGWIPAGGRAGVC